MTNSNFFQKYSTFKHFLLYNRLSFSLILPRELYIMLGNDGDINVCKLIFIIKYNIIQMMEFMALYIK